MPNKATDAADTTNGTSAPEARSWEDVGSGLGEEWDFDRDGALIGNYLGSKTVETDKIETGEATAYQFAPERDPESVVFVWGSWQIADAFAQDAIRIGDLCKITYLGIKQVGTGDDGKPRMVKRFRIQRAAA